MDDRTVETAPRPDRRMPGVGEACALALPVTLIGSLWLGLINRQVDGTDTPADWLREASLALPLVVVLVIAAALLTQRLASRAGLAAGLTGVLFTVLGASAASGALSIAALARALAEPAAAGPGASVLVGLGRDASLSLVAALPLAALTSGLTLGGARPRISALVLASAGRAAVVLAIVGPLGIGLVHGVGTATADAGAGAPCPTGAPVKTFSVQALDVKIPLNRFGDNDPAGKMYALAEQVAAVRAQEATQKVSIGLRDDAIQPLVIRANLGDCVEIDFNNEASGGEYGMHIDGLAYTAASSGDAVGMNAPSAVSRGGRRTYRYYVPKDPELEGTHYIRPGPGNRAAVAHGLFGALSVEPEGSVYLHPDDQRPIRSGWEAIIKRGDTRKAFREYVKVYHEVGDEDDDIFAADGRKLPVVDPTTDSYRPGSRAINYRSEPFMNRLERAEKKSLSYNSYTFGDPATPIMRAYSADPSKVRIIHAGSEMFHVYHLHGGGIRWPQNPYADKSFDYAKTGLNKAPEAQLSSRMDSQSFGPGESYSLEIEGGAGGVQRSIGDLLEHCHIAEHYVSGMWSMWRVFNTRQPDLAPLPDRDAPAAPVDSAGLIGKTMADGTVITKDNLEEWLDELIPPRGKPKHDDDGSVWDWTMDKSDPSRPVALGEPEETSSWPNLPRVVPGHPSALPGDTFIGNRPRILFNPEDGRPSYPLLRTNLGQRAPQTPNGHTGTPFLGDTADKASTRSKPNPWASREDGLCPSGSALRRFNVTSIQLPIQVTKKGQKDPTGKIFVLNKDKAAVRAGDKPAEPLAVRANIGDCVGLTLTTEFEPESPGAVMPQSNLHIHHVQFDPQGSDGASAGMVFDQSVRPYRLVDPKLTADVAEGDRVLHLESVAKFQAGVYIAVGQGTDDIEVNRIESIDAAAGTITLVDPVKKAHPAGQWAGTEFTQLRWYPDVELDNVFWHDHVDGIHGWGKGLVGQLIVEPKGSTYHDPKTGEEVDSGTIVDIRTSNPLAPGLVESSFREMALWTIDDNPVTDSTLNLRAEPWADRLAGDSDPSLLFSSWRHGDPGTPLPRAYRGDPFVIRTINVSGNGMDSLRLAGHRFYLENRFKKEDGTWVETTPTDAVQYGISQRYTAILEGGAGGKAKRAGDYLYMNGIGRRFKQGAWGLLRVLPGARPDLQPLPQHPVPTGAPANPTPTGSRPPKSPSIGNPCPTGAPKRAFEVSAVDRPGDRAGTGTGSAFVPTADAAAVKRGTLQPEPLTLHAAVGDCVEVKFTNQRDEPGEAGQPRASFHVGKVGQTLESSGVNAGFNPEQTVAPGESRTYRYHVDSPKIGSATVADFGGNDTGQDGLYGALVVAPQGSRFSDPETGAEKTVGTQVDVTVPGGSSYRDFSLFFAEDDPRIGGNTMPYREAVDGPALVNYRSEPRPDDAAAFSSRVHGDPRTPVLKAYGGDPVKVHVLAAPGSEQPHAFSLGGLNWEADSSLQGGNVVETASFLPWAGLDLSLRGGAGGWVKSVGDHWYGDMRRAFSQAGMWGLMRVLPPSVCKDIKPLVGRECGPGAQQPTTPDLPPTSTDPGPPTTPRDTPPPPATPDPGADPTPTTKAGSGTSAPAEAPADKPAPPAEARPAPSAGPGKPDVPLSIADLTFQLRQRLTAVRKQGLAFRATLPQGTRVLDVRIGQRSKGAVKTVASARIKVRASGSVRVVWRIPAKSARKLRAGRYVLTVRGGTDAAKLGAAVQRTVELRGPARR